MCPVEKNGSWGYIDKSGNVVIPFEYDNVYGAGDGLAAVVKDRKCGLVDYENKVVVPLEYDDISSYEGGVAYGIKNGQVYLMTDYSPEPPDDGQLHGKISVSGVYNAEGERVTLTVSPDPGYQLDSISVAEDGGTRRVPLSGNGNTYTFAMPPYDVTVDAKFTRIR